jgi:hypothetical protein
MVHPTLENLGSITLSRSTPSKDVCLIGRGNTVTQPSIPTLRRGRGTEKDPDKSVSTWNTDQRKEPRTPIELRRNPFLFITRKKFGQYIYIYFLIYYF